MNELPTYYLEDGVIDKMSLVEHPAVEVDFECFAAQEEGKGTRLAFGEESHKDTPMFFNEEKHLVMGVAMLADTPIYRNNKTYGEHYVMFSPATIEKLEHEFMLHPNDTNLEHEEDTNGVHIVESFIVNENTRSELFSNVPMGSWIVTYKVDDPELWARIKSGEFRGFSIEGWFDYAPVAMASEKKEDSFTNILKKINMSKVSLFMASIARKLQKMADVTTLDGTVLIYEGALEVGTTVFVEDENGETIPAADGTYETETEVIEVVGGEITAITEKEPAEPEAAEEEMEEDTTDTAGAIMDVAAKYEEAMTRIAELEARLAEVEAKLSESNPDEQFKSQKPAKRDWEKI